MLTTSVSLPTTFAALWRVRQHEVMRLATKYGLPRTTMMKFLLKIMANLAEPRGGDVSDRLIVALSKMAPDA